AGLKNRTAVNAQTAKSIAIRDILDSPIVRIWPGPIEVNVRPEPGENVRRLSATCRHGMLSGMSRNWAFPFLLAGALTLAGQNRNLEIYWIDTEGGAATLIISPTGESLLVDTGNPGPDDSDPKRIFEVTKLAGLKKIDMLAITHFHGDHVGGVPALAKMIPI